MKCIICDSSTEYFFSKEYDEPPFDEIMRDVGIVEYQKCTKCGFVISKTHCELDKTKWEEINLRFHLEHEMQGAEKQINQPPYAEQAMMLALLGKNKIIDLDDALDFAGGYGHLSEILSKYFNLELPIFDPYVQDKDSSRHIPRDALRTYRTVINSAMFEHVRSRFDLDQVNDLVTSDGCLILHTVVCETIPKDPNWFYLQPPVHTAFHTNSSMELLMQQWGYKSSIYSPMAKCWVLLRDDIESVESAISALNIELQRNWFLCKKGFVDYWKGF
jgi:hypothetical protein